MNNYEEKGDFLKYLRKTMRIMRLCLFLIGLSTAMAFSANSYSQNIKLTLDLNNATVKEVLKAIENQSEFLFFYQEKHVDLARKVNIHANEKDVETILNQLFAGTDNIYVINDRQIVIGKAPRKELEKQIQNIKENVEPIIDQPQQKEITGKITDTDGLPLPGVSVIVKGTTIGTVTNTDGEFSLNIPLNAETLQFSFVGMRTQEIEVGNQTTINVTMENDAIGIEEVVAVGYGSMKRVNLTGSVAAVSGDKLTVAPSTNTTSMVAGRLPGLIVHQTSGKPGADEANISIRGFGNALVMVDGVERDFTQLDPNEIESISILKDASASIYGARAGNGVVLVTTKRGQDGAPKISLNSSYSSSQPTVFPDYVNAYQYASMLTQAEGGVGSGSTYSEEELDKFRQGTEPGYVSTNWKEAVMREWAPQQLHNLNVRGGNENAKYFFNLGYLNQGSIWESGDGIYQRLNLSSNVDVKISNKLSALIDLSWRREDRDDPKDTESIFYDLSFASPTVDRINFPYPELNQVMAPTRPTENHALAQSYQELSGFIKDKRDVFNSAISLKYELPVKGLSVDGKVALNSFNRINNRFDNEFEVWSYDYENQILSSAGHIGQKSIRKQSYRSQSIITQLALRYNQTFNDHSVSGLLLNEMINEQEDNFWASRNELISGTLPYLFAGNVETQLNGDHIFEDGRQSLVGRLNYGFKSKYLAELSFRYDGSPRFPKDKRWGFFPGVSVGWRISEESFMDDRIFDNLKLRASVNRSGFDGISTYDYLTGYQLTSGNNNVTILGDQTLAQLRSIGLANKNITWETIDLYNVGLDASVFNGQLSMELDAFYRKRGGILANRAATISNTFGASLPAENINSMDNRGFEIVLNHRNKFGDFSYNISANYSFSKAKWIHREERSQFEDEDDERINKFSGQWVNRTFGYLTNGFFNSQEEIDAETVDQDQGGNVSLRPGDIRFVDFNGDGVITDRDRVEIGKGTTPESMFGLTVAADYKGFDFNMLWQGAGGFVSIFNYNANIGGLFLGSGVPLTYQWEYQWNAEKPEKAMLPAPNINGVNSHNKRLNDLYVKDATYLRLKNLSVGYSIPPSVLNGTGIEKFRVYIAATNFITFSNMGIFKDYDPETTRDYNSVKKINAQATYPIQKVLSVGLNITL